MASSDGSINISVAVTCYGLEVTSKSPLKQAGIFDLLQGSGQRTAKNEKRCIKLFQSEYFIPGGRPPSSTYSTIYTSDIIENSTDVRPALLADIHCERDKNCKIRIYVYYSSNLTHGKEILLAGTSFELRDLLASSGVYIPKGSMFSEHCNDAKASVFVTNPVPKVMTLHDFSVIAPSNPFNPMTQRYVFNNNQSAQRVPAVLCEEVTFEPRLATKVSLEYLLSMQQEVRSSSKAWRARYLMERRRQGRYESLEEAFENGWYELEVTIHGSHLALDEAVVKDTAMLSIFVKSIDQKSRRELIANPICAKAGIANKTSSSVVSDARRQAPLHTSSGAKGSPGVHFDILSSNYDIFVETCDKDFCRKLGQTNTEYLTDTPVYGTNVNANLISKPVTSFTAHGASRIRTRSVEYDGVHIELKNDTLVQSSSSIHGAESSLHMYVPSYETLSVKLKLNVDSKAHGGGKGYGVVGEVSIPIGDCLNSDGTWSITEESATTTSSKEFWVPVELYKSSPFTGSAHVLVTVRLRSPSSGLKPPKAPHCMSLTKVTDIAAAVAEVVVEEREDADVVTEMAVSSLLDPPSVLGKCYDWMTMCGNATADPLVIDTTEPQNPSSAGARLKSRFDLQYPLAWLEKHISNIDSVIIDLEDLLDELRHRLECDISFRKSADKKQFPLQAIPINFLGQMLVTNGLHYDDATGGITEKLGVLDAITCGAMTVHARKSKGGIFSLEHCITKELSRLKASQQTLYTVNGGTLNIECLAEFQEFGDVIDRATKCLLSIETDGVEVCHRRILCLSQVLSIVVNGIIMKLNLVAEGHISHSLAESWIASGILVMFEGLLSVTGKERIMLEDSFSVIETLRNFHVRILPLEAGEGSAGGEERRESKIDISISRQEVRLYVSMQSLEALPEAYMRTACTGGCVIKIISILFTQGIDIMQSIATTFSSDSSSDSMNSGDLQKYMNSKSLHILNKFCHSSPHITSDASAAASGRVDSDGSMIHPLLRSLDATIQYTSPTVKDVRLLGEIERVCAHCGGLRVTFCKSGKDRTGMAVTLEQAKYIGKTYNCGVSEDRLLINSNIMRLHGTRLTVTEKNIGRKVYSINKLQAQFLPTLYRPPAQTLEDLIKTGVDLS